HRLCQLMLASASETALQPAIVPPHQPFKQPPRPRLPQRQTRWGYLIAEGHRLSMPAKGGRCQIVELGRLQRMQGVILGHHLIPAGIAFVETVWHHGLPAWPASTPLKPIMFLPEVTVALATPVRASRSELLLDRLAVHALIQAAIPLADAPEA